jgi:hypothetical protein
VVGAIVDPFAGRVDEDKVEAEAITPFAFFVLWQSSVSWRGSVLGYGGNNRRRTCLGTEIRG